MTLTIGQLSQTTGVPTKTIRYYEESGLLPRAKRGRNGYRTYGERDTHLLRFIKRARDLGFSIDNVKSLLTLWSNRNRKSRDVKELARIHLEEVERKICELESLKSTLERLVSHCHGDDAPDCPILEDLAEP